MQRRLINGLLWLLGVCGFVGLVVYLGLGELQSALESVDASSVAAWMTIALVARLLLTEVLVRPVSILGGTIRRSDAFWIGWLRSFLNLAFPLAGAAYLARFIRSRTKLSWGEIAALASPQVLFAALSVAVIGVFAVAITDRQSGDTLDAAMLAFMGIGGLAFAALRFSSRVGSLLPWAVATRLQIGLQALGLFHAHLGLVAWMVTIHSTIILLRALQLGLLFFAIGEPVDWRSVLLLSSIGEVPLLLQITPSGIGVREGTLLGAAVLIGLDAKLVTAVAIVDRLLGVGIVTLFAPLSTWFLSRSRRQAVPSPDGR